MNYNENILYKLIKSILKGGFISVYNGISYRIMNKDGKLIFRLYNDLSIDEDFLKKIDDILTISDYNDEKFLLQITKIVFRIIEEGSNNSLMGNRKPETVVPLIIGGLRFNEYTRDDFSEIYDIK